MGNALRFWHCDKRGPLGTRLNDDRGPLRRCPPGLDGASSAINLLGDYVQTSATAMTQLNGGSLSVDAASQLIFDDVGFNGDMRFELMADLVEGAAQDIAIVNRGVDPTLIGFDQINVFGAANLDGMMLLTVSPGLNPIVGDFFDLITADTLTLQPTFSILGNSAYTYDWSASHFPIRFRVATNGMCCGRWY